MGLRYRKSFGSGPFRMNISKSGIGYSVGTKGFRYTKKAGGGTRTTASIPGTGISYVKETGKQKEGNIVKESKQNNQNSQRQNAKLVSETFRVVGINHYPEAVKSLVRMNPSWNLQPEEILAEDKIGQKIYRFRFVSSPVQLIAEPENSVDPNAVAVLIAGQKVGYVPKETAPLIGSILKKGTVKKIICGINGGQYKIVDDKLDVSIHKSSITITVKITYSVQESTNTRQVKVNSSVSLFEILLAWFLGFLGVHKFYKKKKGMGFLYLFTLGLFCIGWLGDALYLTLQYISQSKGTPATNKHKFFSYAIAVLCALVIGSCGNNSDSLPAATDPFPSDSRSFSIETFMPSSPESESLQTEVSVTTVPTTEAPSEKPTDFPMTEAPTQIPTEIESTEPQGTTYVLNTNTKRFHEPGCSSVADMKESNKKVYTGTKEEIIAMGYTPCKRCNP